MSTATSPSSTKSSGCGSNRSCTPSRSKTGSRSSIDRQNMASLRLACSGRPLNSEFITRHSRSTVIWMARFQYRTAAWRSSSSGPDHRYSGRCEAIRTPAASSAFLNARTAPSSARGWRKNGVKSSRGESSMYSYPRSATRAGSFSNGVERNMYGSMAIFNAILLRRTARASPSARPGHVSRCEASARPRRRPPGRRSRPTSSDRTRRRRPPRRRSSPGARCCQSRGTEPEVVPAWRKTTGARSASAAVPSSPTTSPRMSCP
jgi:hypothetical protein